MAITPSLGQQAAAALKSIPFWDPAAINKSVTRSVDPNTGTITISAPEAPGIWTALPEHWNDPWPDNLSPWDTIKLGGMRAPGYARLTGGRGRRIPNLFIPGASGALPTFMGEDPASFDIKITIWTPKQWDWLQRFILGDGNSFPGILPPPTAKIQPRAVKVEYPGLAILGISDIYIVHVGIPDVDQHQFLTINLNCAEFMPTFAIGSAFIHALPGVTKNPDGTTTVGSATSSQSKTSNSPAVNNLGPD